MRRVLVLLAVAAFVMPTFADLLWDNGPFDLGNAFGNGKGTNTLFGQVDLQTADDFEVPAPGWYVNDGHFEGLCFNGNLQVDYITVEFFEDGGDTLPVEDPFYSEDSYDFTVSDYWDPDWGKYHVDFDVNFGPVTIDVPGVYWVKMQPYGLTNDWHYQGGTTSSWGSTVANRDGPWGGGYGSYTWIHFSGYDQNFKLTGEVIPEPASLCLLGIGALALLRRR